YTEIRPHRRHVASDKHVQAAVSVCVITTNCFGRVVSVIKVFRPKTENALLGHFRPNIFGGRIFGASLMKMMPMLKIFCCTAM
ncbi:uncharacterized, partial [Tachysurus ichikawai]